MEKECKHEWKPLGVTAKEQYQYNGGHILSSGHTERIDDMVVAAIFCNKCGEIKEKTLY